MSDLLQKIESYATDLNTTSRLYHELLNTDFGNNQVKEIMKVLTDRLGDSLHEFATTEQKITVPTFIDLCDLLDWFSEWESVPTYLQRYWLQQSIEAVSAKLHDVLQRNGRTLADVKDLQIKCITLERRIRAEVERLDDKVASKFTLGSAAWLAGGLLAPLTGGWSLLLCLGGSAAVSEGVSDSLASKVIKSQLLSKGLPKSLELLAVNIEVMNAFTGLINVLVEDVKDVSTPKGKVQILMAHRKAAIVREMLQKYVDLTKPAIGRILMN